MAIGPNLPSVEQVLEIAEDFGLDLSADEANTYCKLLRGAIKTYRRLDEMVEFRPPVKYPRTPGYRPGAEDNPFNGWYWRCEIDGAPEGPLAGKTVGVKDAICVAGVPMMNGSRLLEGFIPDVDATVVSRLLDAGATVLGKTNAEDWSFSGAGHTCALGPVRNPRKPTHAPGGVVERQRGGPGDRTGRHGPGRRPGRLHPDPGRLETGAPGYEDACASRPPVVQSLEVVAPAPVLVHLVEYPQLRGGTPLPCCAPQGSRRRVPFRRKRRTAVPMCERRPFLRLRSLRSSAPRPRRSSPRSG